MATAATMTATASPIRRPPRNVRMLFSFAIIGKMDRWREQSPGLQCRFLPHDDLGADRNAIVEIGDVGIDQPEAAGGDLGADRIRPVGAVDAVDGGAEIHRARPQRIARPPGYEARQIGVRGDRLGRRCPVRPLRLARDAQKPLPLEAVAADTDAVADRSAARLDQIEMTLRG